MDIFKLVKKSLGADAFSIGKSACGNDILCVHRGSMRGNQIIITAAIHARECYTALVVLEQSRAFDKATAVGGAYFVPLVNPDGALFFDSGETFGRTFLREHAHEREMWKANAEGVDLNCNFDANFGTGAQNKFVRGASDYVGEYPFCAPETRALAAFTSRVSPSMTVSYHCMGGELYWEFFQSGAARERDMKIADAVAAHIGVKRVDGDLCSAGGYKDWCVQKLGIPAVTVELIRGGNHPFYADAYAADIAANARLPEYILEILRELDQKK